MEARFCFNGSLQYTKVGSWNSTMEVAVRMCSLSGHIYKFFLLF